MSTSTLGHSLFKKNYLATLTIPFPSSRLANIAERALNVDKELKGDQVKRIITTDDDKLIVSFDCASVKMLRVSVNSLFDMIMMITKTMDAFDGLE
ncbi:Pcc1-domain-containing protein [Rhizophagus irregularis]|uniref:Pcc1-domain-containing protein n=1 Tax=Rhizophagus irregularis TaxID=588596 RepID=A0A2I1DT05_9GLOM|nr:Pcc1-domain-containing protein [Rhizophagus irregularis]PKY13020.1 Pcc1-domain-containing protein [Rhizophagus irregularis]